MASTWPTEVSTPGATPSPVSLPSPECIQPPEKYRGGLSQTRLAVLLPRLRLQPDPSCPTCRLFLTLPAGLPLSPTCPPSLCVYVSPCSEPFTTSQQGGSCILIRNQLAMLGFLRARRTLSLTLTAGRAHPQALHLRLFSQPP